MLNLIQDVLESDEKSDLPYLSSQLKSAEPRYLLRNEILAAFNEYCTNHKKSEYFYHSSHLGKLGSGKQVVILAPETSIIP